ncbi:MAG: hypothetical protein GVY10_00920 [Verrucomicrobia bacterium]|nr:hypothetical protein [Verrucomicrobiota bacterium]
MTGSDPWQAATFSGSRDAQTREAAANTTAFERIRWACEMSEAIRQRSESWNAEGPQGGWPAKPRSPLEPNI